MNRKFNAIVKRISKSYPSLQFEDKEDCIRLSGVLDSPLDVVKAGVLASKRGYKGVLNDIRIKGEEIKWVEPTVHSNELDGASPSVLIIGGGLLGLNIARELARYNVKVMIVEKNSDFAMGMSGRMDGNVSADLFLKPESAEWYYSAKGYQMMPRLAKDLSVPFIKRGQLILFSRPSHIFAVPTLKHKAKRQEIFGTKYLNKSALRKLEPNVPVWAKGALLIPNSGIVDPVALTVALAEHLADNGVRIELNTTVEGMLVEGGWIKEVYTSRGTITPQIVVNAAGVFSDFIAEMAKDRDFSILPVKENYMILAPERPITREISRFSIRHRPERIKISATVDGKVIVKSLLQGAPRREDYSTDENSTSRLFEDSKAYLKGVTTRDVVSYFSSVVGHTYEDKLIVRRGNYTKNIIEIIGVKEFALTAFPAIAVDVSDIAITMLDGAKENFDFNAKREKPFKVKNTPSDVLDEKIHSNPAYGEIICRCQMISKGEIIDLLSRCDREGVRLDTISGVKKRLGAGKGRCKGVHCSVKIAEAIAEYYDVPIEDVYEKRPGGVILFDDGKGGDL